MKIVIVVPTYNERDNIGALLDSLLSVLAARAAPLTLLVVDDESPDGTAELVRARQRRDGVGIDLLSAPRSGLGAAYVRGLDHALARLDPDIVVQMDADFSHSPHDIPRLLDALAAGADLAIGSRYVGANRIPSNWGWRRRALSLAGNLIARNWLGLAPTADCTAGFRAWRVSALRATDYRSLRARGYVFLVAMLQRAIIAGVRVVEVPVGFEDRRRGASKLGWQDLWEFAHWAAVNPFFPHATK